MVVEIEQVFHHCAKAFLRSRLWDPESWPPDAVPSRARIAHAAGTRRRAARGPRALLRGEAYSAGLYPSGLTDELSASRASSTPPGTGASGS